MATTLYYFSGTGNTLAIVRRLRDRLDRCEIVSIASAVNDRSRGPVTGEAVGIVTPIYMHNMPHIVSRFLDRIESAEYLFFVYTGAGDLGRGIKRTKSRVRDCGLTLSAVFNVAMPSNYTPYGYPDDAAQARLLADAERALDTIVDRVGNRATHFDENGTGFFKANIFPGPFYNLGYRFIPRMDGSFSVDDTCINCGICAQVCPVENIAMVDGVPEWNHRCEQCFACLQWCPVDAIQYGKSTRDVPRYHHPDVAVKDMIEATGR
jgi:ferredoxin